jgi:hypothetical protein
MPAFSTANSAFLVERFLSLSQGLDFPEDSPGCSLKVCFRCQLSRHFSPPVIRIQVPAMLGLHGLAKFTGLTVLLAQAIFASAADPVDFNRQVRPVLSDLCFRCHGPDVNERQAGLRLDSSDGAASTAGIRACCHHSRQFLGKPAHSATPCHRSRRRHAPAINREGCHASAD